MDIIRSIGKQSGGIRGVSFEEEKEGVKDLQSSKRKYDLDHAFRSCRS